MKNYITLFVFSILILALQHTTAQVAPSYYKEIKIDNICKKVVPHALAESDASKYVREILDALGVYNTTTYQVRACDEVDNAIAVMIDGVPIIAYNRKWLKKMEEDKDSYWMNLSILAHEVGHHVLFHTIKATDDPDRLQKRELAADQYSGVILSRLGATLEQASKAINMIARDSDCEYCSHPSKSDRLKAIAEGFEKAQSDISHASGSVTAKAEVKKVQAPLITLPFKSDTLYVDQKTKVISAFIDHINEKNDIVLLHNHTTIPFDYDPNSKELKAKLKLEYGVNEVNIQGKKFDLLADKTFFIKANFHRLKEDRMVFIKGGTLQIGCTEEQLQDCDDDERGMHEIEVEDYYISRYEVTNEEYSNFLNKVGKFKKNWIDLGDSDCKINKTYRIYTVDEGFEDFPVVEVSYEGAIAYAKWAGGDLPTEEQWEYAARGGMENVEQQSLFVGSDNIQDVAWYKANSNKGIKVAGKKNPNILGLYDMSGNVYEWTKSKWKAYPKGVIEPCDDCVSIRGGSWANSEKNCRPSSRIGLQKKASNNIVGFRIIKYKQ